MSEEKFDVILGDLPELDESNSSGSSHLYTKSFYENVVIPKLKGNGLLVTQVTLFIILLLFYFLDLCFQPMMTYESAHDI